MNPLASDPPLQSPHSKAGLLKSFQPSCMAQWQYYGPQQPQDGLSQHLTVARRTGKMAGRIPGHVTHLLPSSFSPPHILRPCLSLAVADTPVLAHCKRPLSLPLPKPLPRPFPLPNPTPIPFYAAHTTPATALLHYCNCPHRCKPRPLPIPYICHCPYHAASWAVEPAVGAVLGRIKPPRHLPTSHRARAGVCACGVCACVTPPTCIRRASWAHNQQSRMLLVKVPSGRD